jgi:hypothetical protein
MLVSSCNSSNFFALDYNAFKLMETFCKCPQAVDLINLETTVVRVIVGDFSITATDVFINDDTRKIERKMINIPEQRTSEGRITGLAFEVFNCLGLNNAHNIISRAKTISMDLFAREMELQESGQTKGYVPLLQNCQKEWGVDQKRIDTKILHKDWNEEDELIQQEIQCHTDIYRLQWIKLYQDTYCNNNSEDLRSCKTKPHQLCDAEKLSRIDKKEKSKIVSQRFCALFPLFSEQAKKTLMELVQKTCPGVLLGKHFDLAITDNTEDDPAITDNTGSDRTLMQLERITFYFGVVGGCAMSDWKLCSAGLVASYALKALKELVYG